jgi:hypothetical protein
MTMLHVPRICVWRIPRSTTAGLLVLLHTVVVAPRASAQATVRDHRLRYSIVGSLVGSALAGGYYLASDRGTRSGQCDPKGCALPYMAVSGAITGFFLARELDAQRRAELPRTGTRERLALTSFALPSAPTALSIRDDVVVVLSDSGASLFSAGARPRALRRRASALSGLTDVALTPGSERLLIAGRTALYSMSTDSGPATRLLNGDITTVASGDDGWGAGRGRVLFVESPRGGVLVRDSVDVGETIHAITFDATDRSWLVGTDSALLRVASSGSGWRVTGRWPTAGAVRAVARSEHWIATAEGESGVSIWRRETLASGVTSGLSVRGEPRFAYDVAFQGEELVVAGGTDGLVRVTLGVSATVRSVSRDLPFVTLIRGDAAGGLWAGDRSQSSLVRIHTTKPPR